MKRIILLTFSLISLNLLAQNPCACCDEAHQQFDFWVGDWAVVDTAGNQVGENTITKVEANCILQEKWRGSSGGTGTSTNYFDASDSTWNQLWIDNTGSVLKLKGKLKNGVMVLKSDIQQGQNGEYYSQISWTPNNDGTVRQLWEVFDKDGKPLRILFNGVYHRKED